MAAHLCLNWFCLVAALFLRGGKRYTIVGYRIVSFWQLACHKEWYLERHILTKQTSFRLVTTFSLRSGALNSSMSFCVHMTCVYIYKMLCISIYIYTNNAYDVIYPNTISCWLSVSGSGIGASWMQGMQNIAKLEWHPGTPQPESLLCFWVAKLAGFTSLFSYTWMEAETAHLDTQESTIGIQQGSFSMPILPECHCHLNKGPLSMGMYITFYNYCSPSKTNPGVLYVWKLGHPRI